MKTNNLCCTQIVALTTIFAVNMSKIYFIVLFQVKTNSSTPHKNEKNITLNLNIPASVSGFQLEEIDLKYVKKNRKKSSGNKMSNLLIKYFTNRSSNLHLSSVTKENELEPDYHQYEDIKERRDDDSSVATELDRPFRYKNKYPLRLLEKIRSSTSSRNKRREGKLIEGGDDPTNAFGGYEEITRPRRSSGESSIDDESINESDLLALESILGSKTVVMQSPDEEPIATEAQDYPESGISDLQAIFEHAIKNNSNESNEKHQQLKYDKSDETKPVKALNVNGDKKIPENGWFTQNLSNYLLSVVPASFQSSFFGGASFFGRHRRSVQDINRLKEHKSNFKRKTDYNILKRHHMPRFSPAVEFSDPRLKSRTKKPLSDDWNHQQLEGRN